ncbi:hypothetical protein GCM10010411_12500 [Actinomadura fulvescens]|uniref:Uncharacterized protein n=1 Tax=Actinomadura fulvescens TaxID=46160 RepID=A0ABN3PF51_9ACTN
MINDQLTGVSAGFRPVPLTEHWNNRAITTIPDKAAGGFNVWRNSFPAEHLPEPGSRVVVDGVPFAFPEFTPAGDNVRCTGQFLPLPEGRYDWIRLLTAAERRVEDTVALHFGNGQVDFETIRVSDFWAAPAWFGERLAFRTPVMHYPHHVQRGVPATLWSQRVPVTRSAPLTGIRLPRNVALHVFALTLQDTPRELAGRPS